jgi:hypothetical protein
MAQQIWNTAPLGVTRVEEHVAEKEKEIFERIKRSYQDTDAGLLPREEAGLGWGTGQRWGVDGAWETAESSIHLFRKILIQLRSYCDGLCIQTPFMAPVSKLKEQKSDWQNIHLSRGRPTYLFFEGVICFPWKRAKSAASASATFWINVWDNLPGKGLNHTWFSVLALVACASAAALMRFFCRAANLATCVCSDNMGLMGVASVMSLPLGCNVLVYGWWCLGTKVKI